MHVLSAAIVSLVLGGASLGSPLKRDDFELKDSIVHLPYDWVEHPTHPNPPPDQPMTLRIALAQPNIQTLISKLLEISHPDHPSYGQHLSKSEVEALASPAPESLDLVYEWLSEYGVGPDDVIKKSDAGDWLHVAVNVEKAEDLMGCKYKNYYHHETGSIVTRATSYSLPRHLHRHIDLIHPTTMFSRATRRAVTKEPVVGELAKRAHIDPSCNATVTPTCLKELYNTVGYVPLAHIGNRIGVTGYLEVSNHVFSVAFIQADIPNGLLQQYANFAVR
jgi:tripeptidyl-peptidase-1